MSTLRRHTTPEQRTALLKRATALRADGMSLSKTAAEIGTPISTLHDWFRRAGLETSADPAGRPPADPAARTALAADLRARYEAGGTIASITAETPYTAHTVTCLLRLSGVQMRRPGARLGSRMARRGGAA